MIYNNNDVAITKTIAKREKNAVLKGLKLIEAEKMITANDIVVIVPNWVNKSKGNPKHGVTVGDDTLTAIIKWVKKKKPKEIIIASGSGGGDTLEVMRKVGYDKVIEKEKVSFTDLNTGPYVELNLDHACPNKIKVNNIFSRMTKLISFTQLKVHEEATMSSGIKNVVMSFPSTEEHGAPKKDKGIHEDLHGFMRAMAEKIKIDISIVSLNPVMMATGPIKGVAKHTGLVIVGNNPVSVDTICARMIGFKPQAIRYLYELEKKDFKETDIKKIKILGMDLIKAEKIVMEKVYGKATSVD